jgi:fumarate reductase subunit C
MPVTWFLRNRHLVAYALREASSFFVAGYAIFLLVVLARQGQGSQGRQAFRTFFDKVLESWPSFILHLIVLAFVLLHSVTSFNGIGKVTVIRLGEERISPTLIAEFNYLIWVVVSVLIFTGVISWSQAFELGG